MGVLPLNGSFQFVSQVGTTNPALLPAMPAGLVVGDPISVPLGTFQQPFSPPDAVFILVSEPAQTFVGGAHTASGGSMSISGDAGTLELKGGPLGWVGGLFKNWLGNKDREPEARSPEEISFNERFMPPLSSIPSGNIVFLGAEGDQWKDGPVERVYRAYPEREFYLVDEDGVRKKADFDEGKKLPRYGKNVHFEKSASAESFASAHAGTAALVYLYYPLPNDSNEVSLLTEAARLLVPGGRVVIVTEDKDVAKGYEEMLKEQGLEVEISVAPNKYLPKTRTAGFFGFDTNLVVATRPLNVTGPAVQEPVAVVDVAPVKVLTSAAPVLDTGDIAGVRTLAARQAEALKYRYVTHGDPVVPFPGAPESGELKELSDALATDWAAIKNRDAPEFSVDGLTDLNRFTTDDLPRTSAMLDRLIAYKMRDGRSARDVVVEVAGHGRFNQTIKLLLAKGVTVVSRETFVSQGCLTTNADLEGDTTFEDAIRSGQLIFSPFDRKPHPLRKYDIIIWEHPFPNRPSPSDVTLEQLTENGADDVIFVLQTDDPTNFMDPYKLSSEWATLFGRIGLTQGDYLILSRLIESPGMKMRKTEVGVFQHVPKKEDR